MRYREHPPVGDDDIVGALKVGTWMRVWLYAARRLMFLLVVLLGISVVTFCIARVLPGNPAYVIAGPYAGPDDIAKVTAELGLDKPIHVQYYLYLRSVLRGDFGRSWRTGRPVTVELAERFPATLELTTLALLIALPFGILLGTMSAVRRGSTVDQFVRVFSVGGVSIPVFWLGLVLVTLFYYLLGWAPAPVGRLPVGMTPPRAVTGLYVLDSLISGNWRALWASLGQLVLPSVTLAFAMTAPITRMTRSSMLEVLGSDFVRTAYASGLPERIVVYRDALKNALLPVVTMIGSLYGYSLGGEVLIESVFAWPGMGLYAMQSILNMDYEPVQGFVLLSGLIYVAVNLIVDIVYAAIDPRISF